MKKGEYEKTSEALFLWFTQMREKGSPISGPILQAKALEFHKHFKEGEEEFTASVGWLDRWKKSFGVRQLNTTGEKLSACTEEIATFTTKLAKIIQEDFSSDQMYNCDETGLNYKILPSKTFAAREEKSAPGYK
jgi:hypothetical protein